MRSPSKAAHARSRSYSGRKKSAHPSWGWPRKPRAIAAPHGSSSSGVIVRTSTPMAATLRRARAVMHPDYDPERYDPQHYDPERQAGSADKTPRDDLQA